MFNYFFLLADNFCIMPEVEKDEVLQQYHQHSEEVIDIGDISDIPTSAVLSNVMLANEKFHCVLNADQIYKEDQDLNNAQTQVTELCNIREQLQDRPLTAPPTIIARNSLRTFSEPPIPIISTTMLNENKSKFLIPHRIDQKTDCNDHIKESQYIEFTNLDESPREETRRLREEISDPILDTRSTTPIELNRQSWHPHVYAKPPKAPTPHSIGDILGIKVPKKPKPIRTAYMDQDVSRVTINEILNANNKMEETNYSVKYSHHLHDRLVGVPGGVVGGGGSVGGAGGGGAGGVQYNQHYIPRSTSLSEGSEDDSGISDQPLNLSITKSRDTSPLPVPLRPVKHKKGKIFFLLLKHIVLKI